MFVTLRIFLIATLSLFVTLAVSSAETAQLKSSWEWVLAQQKVRIYFDNTKSFGHQSSSLKIIRKMLNKGYKGKFEFVAQPLHFDEVIKKVDVIAQDLALPKERIRWLQTDQIKEPITLSLTGGNDKDRLQKILKTHVFINLQPPLWLKKNTIVVADKRTIDLSELFNYEICPECDSQYTPDPKLEALFQNNMVVPLYGDPGYMYAGLGPFLKTVVEEYNKLKSPKPLLFLALNEDPYWPAFDKLGLRASVVHLPLTSQPTFNWIISRTESFSGISGVNSGLNMLKHGKPFIKLGGPLYEFLSSFSFVRGRTFGKAKTIFYNATEGFDKRNAEMMREFIQQSFDPSSELHHYFKASAEEYQRKYSEDKLDKALEILGEHSLFENVKGKKSTEGLWRKFKNFCEDLLK